MTVFESRVRRAYVRRRSAGEMAMALLFIVVVIGLLAVAACEEEHGQQSTGDAVAELTPEQKKEVVRSWYGEIYPQYVCRR